MCGCCFFCAETEFLFLRRMNWFSSVINLRGDSPTPNPHHPSKVTQARHVNPAVEVNYVNTAGVLMKQPRTDWSRGCRLSFHLFGSFQLSCFQRDKKKNRDADCYQWVSQEERQRRDLSCILYLWCFVLFVCFFCCPVWDLRHIREERSKGLLVLKNSSFAVVIEINQERQPEWKAKKEEWRERTHSNISSSNCRGSLHPSIHPFLSPFLGSGQEVT